MIDLGKVFSRITSLNFVLEIEEKSFRKNLTSNCIELLKLDVSQLINSFHSKNTVIIIEDYQENSLWYNLG